MRGRVMSQTGTPQPGVLVSDGVTVTSTLHDGSFSLIPKGPFVFVTRPAGTSCQNWFVPSATEEFTFVLRPGEDLFPHKFIHISDTHVGRGPYYPQPTQLGSGPLFSQFLGRVAETVPDLSSVVATGDLTDRGIDDEYAELRVAVESSPLPIHLLPGNHDHMGGSLTGALSRNNYAIHTADPSAYERNLGPRWYSFDMPGLHVIALDWHTHELGIDHEVQDAWIKADLESISTGTPWILLSHDQPWHSILGGLPHQPIATFSGHRHTSRVVKVGTTLHVNTPTPLFAGLDFSPPSFRVVRWDGEEISLDTRTMVRNGLERSTFSLPSISSLVAAPPQTSALARWRTQLGGAAHTAPVLVSGDMVIASVKDEDRAYGAIEALDLHSGALRWRAELNSSVKSTPARHGNTLIAVEVSGDVVALDLETGRQIWHNPSPDPLRLFAFADPLIHDGTVVVGDMSHLRGLDADSGRVIWERTDLSPYQSFVDRAAPVIAGDTLVVGSWPSPESLVGLDSRTGATVWPAQLSEHSLDDAFGALDTSVGTPLFDRESGDLFVSTIGAVARVAADTGASLWRRPMNLPWNPAIPVATDFGIAVVDAGAGVLMLDRDSGELHWSAEISGTAPFPLSSYQRTPQVLFAGPTLIENWLLVPTVDGWIVILDCETGSGLGRVEIGIPVAAPVVVAGDSILVVDVNGGVSSFDRSVFEAAVRAGVTP